MIKVLEENPRYLIDKSIRALSKHTGFNRKTLSSILNKNKTNNYNYGFEYAIDGQTTIEMVTLVN